MQDTDTMCKNVIFSVYITLVLTHIFHYWLYIYIILIMGLNKV